MNILAACRRLSTAATVFFGDHGAVSQLARRRQVSRQALYREADVTMQDVDGTAVQQEVQDLHRQVEYLSGRVVELEARLSEAVVIDADQQARFASTAQAEGVSLPVTRRLLRVLVGPRTPSVAKLGRMTRAAAQRAQAVLATIDAASRPLVEQAAADEIFFGRRPCLMLVEQQSMCWLTGRLVDRRNGEEWAKEFRQLPHVQQLTRDAGNALAKGVALVNAERRQQERALVSDQEDVFHALHEGGRPLRQLQSRSATLLAKAEAAQDHAEALRRQGLPSQGKSGVAAKAWRRAERAMDEWSAAEKAWQQVGQALQLFTPAGELNTRAKAEAVLQAVLPRLTGPGWSKAKRLLQRPQLLTFLERAQQELAALPVAAEVREAAVRIEGLRRQEEALRGSGRSAACLRGVLLAAGMVISLTGSAGAEAQALVRQVLRGVWRASSLVECINSVARMQQARHRKMTQGLLDLKRLYWNCREFRTGRRRRQTPYGMLGLKLPTSDWWELLNLPPKQRYQQVSAPRVAA